MQKGSNLEALYLKKNKNKNQRFPQYGCFP